MCGRYTLTTPAEALEALFGLTDVDAWEEARYNIAPQTKIVTVRQRAGARVAHTLLWGAVNSRDSRPVINARSETVATSPLFARAFSMNRILVPADGFFEWTNDRGLRRARYFRAPDGGAFAFAGLAVAPPQTSDEARDEAAVILTTAATASVREYHNRMPLRIEPRDFAQWLDRGTHTATVLDLIASGSSTEWKSHPVGAAVNNVRNDSPECVAEAEHLPPPQGSLF